VDFRYDILAQNTPLGYLYINLLYSRACYFTDAMYRLFQNLPRLRFNKDGNLLAVTTADNGFKILANTDGLRTLRAFEARSFEASKASIDMKVLE